MPKKATKTLDEIFKGTGVSVSDIGKTSVAEQNRTIQSMGSWNSIGSNRGGGDTKGDDVKGGSSMVGSIFKPKKIDATASFDNLDNLRQQRKELASQRSISTGSQFFGGKDAKIDSPKPATASQLKALDRQIQRAIDKQNASYEQKYASYNKRGISAAMRELSGKKDKASQHEYNWLKENQYRFWTANELKSGIAEAERKAANAKQERSTYLDYDTSTMTEKEFEEYQKKAKAGAAESSSKSEAAAMRRALENLSYAQELNKFSEAEREKLLEYGREKSAAENIRTGAMYSQNIGGQSNPFLSIVASKEAAPHDKKAEEIRAMLKKKGYSDEQVTGLLDYSVRAYNQETARQMAEEIQELSDKGVGGKVLASAVSVPMNLAGGVTGSLDLAFQRLGAKTDPFTGERQSIDFNSRGQTLGNMAQTIRSTVSKDMSGVGSFIYNTGMSIADFLAVSGAGVGAEVLLGSSAAQSAAQEAHRRGASDDQALMIGLTSGVAEALFEHVSLDKLKAFQTAAKGTRLTAGEMAASIGKQSLVEGSEEAATTLANTFTDAMIMADKSQINQAIKEYQAQGFSEDEATRQAWKDWAIQLGLDALGGALSGGVTGGGTAAVTGVEYAAADRALGKAVVNAKTDYQIVEESLNMPQASTSYQIAKRLQDKISKGQEPTAKEYGRLAAAQLEDLSLGLRPRTENVRDNAVVIEETEDGEQQFVNRMGEYAEAFQSEGMSAADATRRADYLSKLLNGEEISGNEIKNPEKFGGKTEATKNAFTRVTGIEVPSGLSNGPLVEFYRQGAAEYRERQSAAEAALAAEGEALQQAQQDFNQAVEENEQQAHDEAQELLTDAMMEEMFGQPEEEQQEPQPQREPAKTREQFAEEYARELMEEEGITATPEQIEEAWKRFSDEDGVLLDDGSMVTRAEYYDELRKYYQTHPKHPLNMTDDQLEEKYQEARIGSRQKPGDARAFGRNPESVRPAPAAPAAPSSPVTPAAPSGYSVSGNESEASPESKGTISKEMDWTRAYLERYFSNVGIAEIKFNGTHMGSRENARITTETDENGNERNVIWLNENRLTYKAAIYWAVGHEITHPGMDSDAGLANEIIDVLSSLKKSGDLIGANGETISEQIDNFDKLVEERAELYRQHYAELGGYSEEEIARKTTPEKMREEIAADWMGAVLMSQPVLERIAGIKPNILVRAQRAIERMRGGEMNELLKTGKNYAQAAEELDALVDRLHSALEKAKTDKEKSTEGTMVREMGESTTSETNDNGELVIATNDDNHSAAFSLATWEPAEDNRAGGKEKLEQALRENGHTQEEIDDVISRVDEVAEFLESLGKEYADMGYTNLQNNLYADIMTDVRTHKQVLSALVKNGEYPVNLDLALVCKKRVSYMRLIGRLVQDGVLDQVTFSGDAIAKVNDILREEGYETACLGCFVESRRLQIQNWAESIVNEWNDEVDQRTDNAEPFGFAQGKNSELTAEDLDAIELEYKNNKLNDKGNMNLGTGSVKTKMGKLLDKAPSLLQHLTVEDLLTPQGISALRQRDASLFSLVQQRYGAASPKIVQEFNPYNGEIADLTFSFAKKRSGDGIKGANKYIEAAKRQLGGVPKQQPGETKADYAKRKREFNRQAENAAMRKYLYDIGGARMQSFSDFMIENVFDYMQMYADLAAKKLPMHGYTKEITCLRLFGMTGAKWNGSLIAHAEKSMGKERAGLLPVEEASGGRGIVVTDPATGEQYAICFDDYQRHQATGSFIQSIGFKDILALQLDHRYSANVGSITIGVSDAQIRALLNHPLFSMVIPYHASGMLPQYAARVGVDVYNDYTAYQNTRPGTKMDSDGNEISVAIDVNGNPITQKTKKGEDYAPGVYVIKDGTPTALHADTHYDFNAKVQELADARAAAQAYLEWCNELHPIMNGKTVVGYETFLPKFSNSPEGYNFAFDPDTGEMRENYYKLLADFTSYDSVTGASAVQGDVGMRFPGEAELSDQELEEYKQRLRDTGVFTEEEIERYAEKAQMSFKDIVRSAVEERYQYQQATEPKWEQTVGKVEDALLGDESLRSTPEERQAERDAKKQSSDSETHFSLHEFPDGRRFVKLDRYQGELEGLTGKALAQAVLKYMKSNFNGKVLGIDNRAFFNRNGAHEYAYPSKRLSHDLYDAKMRAGTELDNLLDAGENFRTVADGDDGHQHDDMVGDFHYYDTIFQIGDQFFSGRINIMPVEKGLLFKDITQIKNITKDVTRIYGQNPTSGFLRDVSMESVPQREEEVNNNRDDHFSVGVENPFVNRQGRQSDTDYFDAANRGDMNAVQQMVDAAAESAMPNSVIRDAQGKLLRVYHGTPRAGFNRFSYEYSGQEGGTVYGYGHYFTPSENEARLYTQGKSDTVYSAYINIENPIVANNQTSRDFVQELFRRLPGYAITNLESKYGSLENAQDQFVGKRNEVLLSALPNDAGMNPEVFNNTLMNMGYDGVIAEDEGYGEEYVAFTSEQIKLADPITYDDNGNIIPLSKRFNRAKPDIRFSVYGENPFFDAYMEKMHGSGRQQYAQDHPPKQRQSQTNSTNPMYTPEERQIEGLRPKDLTHTVVPDAGMADMVSNRLDADYAGEKRRLFGGKAQRWDASDTATAEEILKREAEEARRSGNYDEVKRLQRIHAAQMSDWGLTGHTAGEFAKSFMGIVTDATETVEQGVEHEPANRGKRGTAKRVVDDLSGASNDAAGQIQQDIAAAAGDPAKRRGKRGGRRKGQQQDTEAPIGQNMIGEPFTFEFSEAVGTAMANSMMNRLNQQKRAKTFLQEMQGHIMRFAAERMPRRRTKMPTTPTELLREYIQNREFYEEAWSNAQEEIRRQLAARNMDTVPEELDGFLNGWFGVDANGNPQNKILRAALAHSALSTQETADKIRKQAAIGATNISQTIAEDLIRETGAQGEIADTLRSAAQFYVDDVLNQQVTVKGQKVNFDQEQQTKVADAQVTMALREVGKALDLTSMGRLGSTSGQTKADMRAAVIDTLINKFAVRADDAENVASVVGDRFDTLLREGMNKRLASIFKERKAVDPAKQKTFLDRVIELTNLGAMDSKDYHDAAISKLLDGYTTRRGVSADDVLKKVYDYATELDAIPKGDLNGLRGMVERLNAERWTGGMFKGDEIHKTLAKALDDVAMKRGGDQFLRDLVAAQIRGVANDNSRLTPVEAMDSWRYLSMLSKMTTVMRNLVGNTAFDAAETVSNNIAVPLDILLSKFTGRRTTTLDRSVFAKTKWEGMMDAARRAYIETALDAPIDDGMNRWEQRDGRTYKMAKPEDANAIRQAGNVVERFLSTMEKWQRYLLTVSDEFAKGGVRAETQRGIDTLIRKGHLEEGALADWADQTALERTFQNEGAMAKTIGGMRNALDTIGIEDYKGNKIGLGKAVMPFARVPANIAAQIMNYSPLGAVNVARDVIAMAKAGKNVTAEQQARLVRDAGRAANGTMMITMLMGAALKGILSVAGLGGDDDETALERDEGKIGTQVNLDAFNRWIAGESTEWRDGDDLLSVGGIEPLNGPMAMAAFLADSADSETQNWARWSNANILTVMQAMMDLPAVSQITNIINAYRYSDEKQSEDNPNGGATKQLMDAVAQGAGDYAGTFVPNILSGVANAMDAGRVRTTQVSDKRGLEAIPEEVWNSMRLKIPGQRSQLPQAQDSFGNPRQTTAGAFMNALNANILPVGITKFRPDAVSEELMRLRESGEQVTMPPRNPVKTVPTADGNKKLTAEERRTYQQTVGGFEHDSMLEVMSSRAYQNADDKFRADVWANLKSYATAKGKTEVGGKAEIPEWSSKGTGSVTDKAIYRAFINKMNAALPKSGVTTGRQMQELLKYANGDNQMARQLFAQILDNNQDRGTLKKIDYLHGTEGGGYSYSQLAAFYNAKNEKRKEFGLDKNGEPKARKKDDLIAWATQNGFTQDQALWLYKVFGGYVDIPG